jgi:hypothetical protein
MRADHIITHHHPMLDYDKLLKYEVLMKEQHNSPNLQFSFQKNLCLSFHLVHNHTT